MSFQCLRFANNPELQAAGENKPPLRQGARGEAVAILQQALVDLGIAMPISTGGGNRLPDGIYGNETAAAVRAFQRVNGLKVDGIAGRQTLSRLDELTLTASQLDETRDRIDMQTEPPRRRPS